MDLTSDTESSPTYPSSGSSERESSRRSLTGSHDAALGEIDGDTS